MAKGMRGPDLSDLTIRADLLFEMTQKLSFTDGN